MKNKQIRSPKHLKRVAGLPCLITKDGEHCNQEACAHHLTIIRGARGMGQKAGDDKTVPLCHAHHMQLHRMGERAFWDLYGFTIEWIIEHAKELWRETNG